MNKRHLILILVPRITHSPVVNIAIDIAYQLSKNFSVKIVSLSKNNYIQEQNYIGNTLGVEILYGFHSLWKYLSDSKFNSKVCLHSFGFMPDVVNYIIGLKFRRVFISTILNTPSIDYFHSYNPILAQIMKITHRFIIQRKKENIIFSSNASAKVEKASAYSKVIWNGIDFNKFSMSSKVETKRDNIKLKFDITSNDYVFIYSGRLVALKNVDEVIHSFLQLNTKCKVYLFIVGDGNLYNQLKKRHKNSNIIFTGRVDDVRPYLAISDCYISASKTEGLPLSAIESLRMGCDIILSNIEQHEELLQELDFSDSLYNLGNKYDLIDIMKRKINKKKNLRYFYLYDGLDNFSRKTMLTHYKEYYLSLIK